ncbi:MAG: hypothetical protein ACLGGX_08805 [Bdellovibrionia bacterium]
MKVSILVFLISLMTGVAQAKDCIPKAEMQKIASHFKQFRNLANNDYCYDGSQTANLLQALMFMRETSFATNMDRSKDDLFSGRFAKDWYGYFIGRIGDIDVQASCPKGVGAFVYGFGDTMYVCPMMLTETFSALDRASVFMHEARHIDGYPHTTCRQGPRAGIRGACDSRISEGGSYAVSVETYAQLAKYAVDIHPALKAYAMNSAVTYADEAFEVPVKVDRKEELLAMADNKQFYSIDLNTNAVKALGQTPHLGKIVKRAQQTILIPEDKNQTARYVFANNEGEIVQSAGEMIVEYNSKPANERALMRDLHIGGQWTARVFADKVIFTCNPSSPSTETVNFPKGQATGLMYLDGYSRNASSTYVQSDLGELYELGCSSGRAFIRASNKTLPGRFVRVQKAQNQIIALNEQGQLVNITSGQAQVLDFGLSQKIFEITPRQSFEFIDAN